MSDWVSRGHAAQTFEDLPIPVVAKSEATLSRWRVELALACDLIVCDESAKLGLTEANIGFVPGWGGSYRLPRVDISETIVFTAEMVEVESALSIGLVDELVEGAGLDDWLSNTPGLFHPRVRWVSARAFSMIRIGRLEANLQSKLNAL